MLYVTAYARGAGDDNNNSGFCHCELYRFDCANENNFMTREEAKDIANSLFKDHCDLVPVAGFPNIYAIDKGGLLKTIQNALLEASQSMEISQEEIEWKAAEEYKDLAVLTDRDNPKGNLQLAKEHAEMGFIDGAEWCRSKITEDK